MHRKLTAKILPAPACLLFLVVAANAANLQPDTLAAWEEYRDHAAKRCDARLHSPHHFLWADEDPGRLERLRNHQIEVGPAEGTGCKRVPGGLIHDWIGAVFIPGVSLDQVFAVLADYGRYKFVYHPEVVEARLLSHSREQDEFSLKIVNKILFISTGVDLQCRGRTLWLGDHRAFSTSQTERVEEIRNYGSSNERTLPPDTGDGFIWRLQSFIRYEERDGGVYLETETLALTRDIPSSLSFALVPLVKKLSRNSLVVSLRQTSDAVHQTLLTKSAPPVLKADYLAPRGSIVAH